MSAAGAVSQLGVVPPEQPGFHARPTERQIRRITPVEDHRMLKTKALRKGAPVVLWEGLNVKMPTCKPAHHGTMTLHQRHSPRLIPDNFLTRSQCSIDRICVRASTPVFWISNQFDRRKEGATPLDSRSESPAYRSRVEYLSDDQVPVVLDGQAVANIPVSTLLL